MKMSHIFQRSASSNTNKISGQYKLMLFKIIVSDNILKKLGHVQCFSFCFFFYALRLSLISLVRNPWTIVIIEFVLQGPTFALTYITIVAYANEIAPPGASATMQGIAAGLDDGLGKCKWYKTIILLKNTWMLKIISFLGCKKNFIDWFSWMRWNN